MELTRAEIDRIESECLQVLREQGIVPDGKIISPVSGSLGIRKLGKIDFLSNLGYTIIWRFRK